MSVFKKVVSRVRDFFLEPEPQTPPPGSVAPQSPTPVPKSAIEKPDAFEWEPPEKWRASSQPSAEPSPPLVPWSDGSASGEVPRQGRPPVFSARNFSTEELQKSSILDIVEAADKVPSRQRPVVAELELDAEGGPGFPTELLEELAKGVKAPSTPSVMKAETLEIAPLLVEEIPRPPASSATVENLGFASMLRQAALRVDEREIPSESGPPTREIQPDRNIELDSPSWTLAARSMAGIEAVPPPFALDGTIAAVVPEVTPPQTSTENVDRPPAHDSTRTGEIDRPSFLIRPEPSAAARTRGGRRQHRGDSKAALLTGARRAAHVRNAATAPFRDDRPKRVALGLARPIFRTQSTHRSVFGPPCPPPGPEPGNSAEGSPATFTNLQPSRLP